MWIPISACYPPDAVPVWLFLADRNIITGCRNEGEWFQCWDVYYIIPAKNKTGSWEAEHVAEEIIAPTHWQYLPTPPVSYEEPIDWEQE